MSSFSHYMSDDGKADVHTSGGIMRARKVHVHELRVVWKSSHPVASLGLLCASRIDPCKNVCMSKLNSTRK